MRESGDTILASGQYSAASLGRYEWVFGQDFLSSGAMEMAQRAAQQLGLRPGLRVLDVGSGFGGSAFHFAGICGVQVLGLDILPAMVADAQWRACAKGLTGVEFICGDVLTAPIATQSFDSVYSKDSFLHVRDNRALANQLIEVLVPGGRLFVTDYLRGRKYGSNEFESYAASSGYELVTCDDYVSFMREAGFVDIRSLNWTTRLIDLLCADIDRLCAAASDTQGIAASDAEYLLERWRLKVRCLRSGDMKWMSITARKPTDAPA